MRYVLKGIIEVLIAVALFIALVRFTPVFDGIMHTDDTTSTGNVATGSARYGVSDTYAATSQDLPVIYRNNTDTASTVQYGSNRILETQQRQEIQAAQGTQERQECVTPRGSMIPHGTSVLAYASTSANQNNVCVGEQRYCEDGRLRGSFVHTSCSYTIDGMQQGNAMVQGATDSLSQQIASYTPPSQEYIQPTRPVDGSIEFNVSGKPREIDPPSAPRVRDLVNEAVDGNEITNKGFLLTEGSSSFDTCRTPWGESVDHGAFVYAYNIPLAHSVGDVCRVEKRACIDGALQGSFVYEECVQQDTRPPVL